MDTTVSNSSTVFEDTAARITEMAEQNSWDVLADETWVSVHKPGLDLPGQGWKLHVSARPGTLEATLDRVLPMLFHLGCDFKVVRSVAKLREINSGDGDLAAVGKAITVYPPQESVVKVGQVLAAALSGFAAARVPSDRRVRRDAPVYYRYAPFVPQYRVDDNGDFELVLIGPDGEFLPGAAGPEFRCPPWARDPFRPEGGAAPEDTETAEATPTLGGRYRLASGVVRGARGNVYRAEDTTSGAKVVIKEARAYVGENLDGTDLRLHIRNERRILQALAGVGGVPGLIDHFRHGEDEYLVITEVGSRDLNRFVGEYGAFADDPAGSGHSLGELATQLLALLDAVHARGVVIRDLSPKNVVLDETGRCTLVDFGNSRYEGFQIPGWTPGYSIPDQRTGRESEPSDDLFALGATLFFAATAMHPVTVDPDPVRAVERTLMCLAARFPGRETGVVGLIPGLLSLDPAARSAAADALREGRHRTARVTSRTPHARPPAYSPDLLGSVIEHTVRECARFAGAMMTEPPDHRTEPPQTNVHAGSAGLGMELLHHAAARTAAGDLARWTAEAAPDTGLPAALYFGRTGTSVFLETARTALGLDLPRPAAIALADGERGDYIHGLAGIGAGHLLLGGPERLAVAAECARRLLAGEATVSEDAVAPSQPGSGVAVETGFAHGEAGIAFFLLSYAQATGDAEAAAGARARFGRLAAETASLVEVMRGTAARPMGASWCQGMAGIAAAHVRAAQAYDDDDHLALAREGARVCLAMAPQAWVVTQCCGLSGIGELAIDVAQATGEEEFWRGAEHVFELILARSGGEMGRPVLPGNALDTEIPGWEWVGRCAVVPAPSRTARGHPVVGPAVEPAVLTRLSARRSGGTGRRGTPSA